MINIRRLKRRLIPRFVKVFIIIIGIIIVLSTAFFATWHVKTIHVKGSVHYSDDTLIKKVIKTKFDHNTILLYLKNKYMKQDSIPFIERIDVEIANKNTVNLVVYEKAVIGCVEYMGQYLYFDKDGIVVESSSKKLEDIPYITGLNFEKIILHEKLEITNEELYSTILDLAQLIDKFDLAIDQVNFNLEQEVTLKSGNITILLGMKKTYDEQLSAIKDILPLSKGLKGSINLKNYTPGDDIIFDKEK